MSHSKKITTIIGSRIEKRLRIISPEKKKRAIKIAKKLINGKKKYEGFEDNTVIGKEILDILEQAEEQAKGQ